MNLSRDYPLRGERKALAGLLRFFRKQGMDKDDARLNLIEIDQMVEISEAEAYEEGLIKEAERVYGQAIDFGYFDTDDGDSDADEIFKATRTSVLCPGKPDSEASLGNTMGSYIKTRADELRNTPDYAGQAQA